MRFDFGKVLACIAVAGLVIAAQFGAASPAEARRGVHAARHVRVSGVRRVNVKRVHVQNYSRHRVARGVAVGVATGVVVNSAVRVNSCSNLAYRCNRGDVGACISYDQRCY